MRSTGGFSLCGFTLAEHEITDGIDLAPRDNFCDFVLRRIDLSQCNGLVLSEVCLVPIEDFYSQWHCSVLFEVWDFKGNRKRPPDLVEKDVTVVAIMGLRGPDIVPNTYVPTFPK